MVPCKTPGLPSRKPCRMLPAFDTEAACLHACHFYPLVADERMKQADGIAPTADTGDEMVRESPLMSHDLLFRFVPDDRLKITDHHGIRMGAQNGAQDVMGGRTLVVQSRMASLIASLSVRLPASTAVTLPQQIAFETHSMPAVHVFRAPCKFRIAIRNTAAAVAVATPCCPAPVSAMTRGFFIRRPATLGPPHC